MPYGTVNADVISTSVANTSLGAGNASVFKNRIINGDMRIDQRNAGASVTPANTGQYLVDRWQYNGSQASKVTAQQNAGSVTPPTGFINYQGITSSSAYSVTSTDYFQLFQPIEGLNVTDLGWGTANAKTVTLSAWIYSSLTGTFGGSLRNSAVNRSYPFSYTISSANTWTQISVTITGDTSGTWLTTNGVGIYLAFSLGSGSTFSSTAGSWAAGNYISATGATSVVGTNGATFYITGVQLEVGTSATGFEYVNYGTQLVMCQRYFQTNLRFGGASQNSTTDVMLAAVFPVTLRTTPTMGVTGAIGVYDGSGNYSQSSATAGSYLGNAQGGLVLINNFTGMTNFRPCIMNTNAGVGSFTASAEL
jgi:hypothetical protein